MIKHILLALLVLALGGSLVAAQSEEGPISRARQNFHELDNFGPAPELQNMVFLNTDTPLRLADLRGQVVLLEFWTFGCINCQRTLPYVQSWHETYADEGLVVIGDHYPEFAFERDIQSVQSALDRFGLTYPIALDNDRATWGAYQQRFWPTIYLIDKAGNIRYKHIGEGRYEQTEAAIQTLLAEEYTPEDVTVEQVTRQFLTPTDPVNVRRGPEASSSRVGTILPGMVFVILGEQDGWYEIQFDGHDERFVSGEFVSVEAW